MTRAGLFALVCVVACGPQADAGPPQRNAIAPPSGRNAIAKHTPAPPPATARAPLRPRQAIAAPLRAWEPPPLDLEQGSCWVRLRRLPAATIQATRTEFLQRNPDWELNPIHVDPFTGLVVQANFFRRSDEIGPPAELTQREYARRRLEPLQDNADLIGISERELKALRWGSERFAGSNSTFMGSTARATAMRSDPALKALGDLRGGWSVTVRFQRDGEVSGFSAERTGPPVALCNSPRVTAAQARAARGLTDASAQPESLGYFSRGFTVGPGEIGDARLTMDMFMDGGPSTRATSVTWRLVWAVDVQAARFTFLVDAVSGEVTGLRKNFMQ